MKKYFYLAAVSAMMLTACSSDKDVLQPTPEPSTPQVVAQQQAVGFDVYVPAATASTRSGRTNVMDNSTLQTTGFGVFGYQVDGTPGAYDKTASTGSTPNYMWNQQVNYISNAWGYSPLKYWPNETANDSQSSAAGMADLTTSNKVETLSFFAYAPWVKGTPVDGSVESVYPNEAPATTPAVTTGAGIVLLPTNATAGDPKIHYVVATNPSQSVDLLWGVAPVGDLVYTAVDASTKRINEGMPLINLKKPAVNTSMKFLFQHALARLGVKVVLAADQVSAGGNFDVANSKVTIEEIAIKGNFGSVGDLNLNNTVANKAEWEGVTTAASTPFVINATNGLAAHLRFDTSKGPEGTPAQQTVTGVTTQYSDAIQVSNIPGYSKSATTPGYSATVPYFASATAHEGATPAYAAYTAGTKNYAASSDSVYLQKNVLSGAYTDISSTISTTYPNATVWSNIYSLKKTTGLLEIIAENKEANKGKTAYRKHGNTYYPTGQAPLVGEYVFADDLKEVTLGTTTGTYYLANSNYFMVIPPTTQETADKKIKVKITYYVSTTDPNVANEVVYTKNEVEKEIELPHFKNGVAYNLKLILGMTSVKLEAEATDWVTTTSEIYLPQNTAE